MAKKFETIIEPEEDKTVYDIEHLLHGGVIAAAYDRGNQVPASVFMDARKRTVSLTFEKPIERSLYVVIIG